MPAYVSVNPFHFNLRDRAKALCEAEGASCGAYQANATVNATATSRRRRRLLNEETGENAARVGSQGYIPRLAHHDDFDDFRTHASAGGRNLLAGPNCSPVGSCYGTYDLLVNEIEVIPDKYTLTIEQWKNGCALKSITLAVNCSTGVQCYGTCSGTTTLLCQSTNTLSCGVGAIIDITSVAGEKIKNALDKLNVKGELQIEVGYTSTKTIYLKFIGSIIFGNLKRRRRRRGLLLHDAPGADAAALAGPGGSHEEEDELDDEDQVTLEETLDHITRRRLQGLKKFAKKTKKKMKKATKVVVSTATSVVASLEPKNGIKLSVTGLGSYDFSDNTISVTAGISATFCILSICTSVTVNIVDYSKTFNILN